mmetsp:Transcript_30624/g.89659  ORF Transcript_30624/g.89659 Transcript_30624/m.89659 type:complete len:243 (-) Transcript_30624:268-996(-)
MVGEVQPDAVVHLAAISSPVGCDKDPEKAMAVNVPTALLDVLPPHAAMIFLSTDQVYDGLGAPYGEESPAKPVNTYGESKLAFEKACLERRPERSVCLRSSLILGPPTRGKCRKQSFVQFCDERLAADAPTDFFSDEWRAVVYVDDIVRTIAWFIDGGAASAPGVYCMGGPERVTRVSVAEAVAARRGYPTDRIKRVERASLPPSSTASPPDISMDSRRLAKLTGVEPTTLEQLVAITFPAA